MTSKRTKDNPSVALVPTPAIHEVGPSHPVVLNKDIIGNAGLFSSFNRRSKIKPEKFDRMGDDFNFANEYFVMMPDANDKVYTEINAFIYRCKLKGVELSTRLFWHHFNLIGSKKCPGFYAIGLRPKRQKWTYTVSSNRTAYTEWVYLFGPGLDGLNNWAAEPRPIPKYSLEDGEKVEYAKLLEDWTEDDILSASEAVDERHLLRIHVSGWNVDLEKRKERMRANTKAKALAKQSASLAIDKALGVASTDNRTDDRDISHIEATEAVQSRRRHMDVMDLTAEGFVSKCLRIGEDEFSVQLPRSAMVSASPSSVTFGHQVSSFICLPDDQDKRDLPLSVGNEQALAHATQAVMWIASQAKESLQASETRLKLQEDLEMERMLKIKAETKLR